LRGIRYTFQAFYRGQHALRKGANFISSSTEGPGSIHLQQRDLMKTLISKQQRDLIKTFISKEKRDLMKTFISISRGT
jgi:hypothetical protein